MITRRTVLGSLPLLPLAARATTYRPRSPLPRLPFVERVGLEPGELRGTGLDGRLSYDLRRLLTEPAIVGNDDFYVRTRVPAAVASRAHLEDWTLRLEPGEDASGHQVDFAVPYTDVGIDELRRRSRPMGAHLLECSGNTSRARFGLLSVAEWSGVPVAELLDEHFWNLHETTLLEIKGNDEHAAPSRSSLQGASWVFTAAQLRRAGAFLATGMNGRTLPPDHGAPLRLLVPNWYGCACIKWVESMRTVPFNYPAPGQMQEFAGRTHQNGRPERAADYIAATIDFTAMPIVVEGPDEQGGYRTSGVAWGDPAGVCSLFVRYAPRGTPSETGAWLPVESFKLPAASTWSLWQHRFTPERAGEVEIRLRVGESSVRTRRLDSGFYARQVVIPS